MQNEDAVREACRALMFATITTEGKHLAMENDQLLDKLIQLTHSCKGSIGTAMYAVKTLTNLAELPQGKLELIPRMNEITNMCLNPEFDKMASLTFERQIEIFKQTLLWQP